MTLPTASENGAAMEGRTHRSVSAPNAQFRAGGRAPTSRAERPARAPERRGCPLAARRGWYGHAGETTRGCLGRDVTEFRSRLDVTPDHPHTDA
jgi:hypothetical protein